MLSVAASGFHGSPGRPRFVRGVRGVASLPSAYARGRAGPEGVAPSGRPPTSAVLGCLRHPALRRHVSASYSGWQPAPPGPERLHRPLGNDPLRPRPRSKTCAPLRSKVRQAPKLRRGGPPARAGEDHHAIGSGPSAVHQAPRARRRRSSGRGAGWRYRVRSVSSRLLTFSKAGQVSCTLGISRTRGAAITRDTAVSQAARTYPGRPVARDDGTSLERSETLGA